MPNMKAAINNTFTGLLVICAILVTVSVLHKEFGKQREPFHVVRHLDKWRYLVSNRHVIGSRDAPVKIIEFSDYECPFCRDLEPKLEKLIAANPHKVALIRYDFPLTKIHSHAYEAAIAADCAARQGIYKVYQDALFNHGEHLKKIDLVTRAKRVGIGNVALFKTCLQTGRSAKHVASDRRAGEQLGINATPTLVVNGDVIPGTHSQTALDQLLNYEYRKTNGAGFWNLITRFF